MDFYDMILASKLTGGTKPSGTINITENGTYDVTEKAEANVNVVPQGEIDISTNGTYNVKDYASAWVGIGMRNQELAITFRNNSGADASIYKLKQVDVEDGYKLYKEKYTVKYNKYTILGYPFISDDNGTTWKVTFYDLGLGDPSDYEISNLTNCTYDNNGVFTITDITLAGRVTIKKIR